MTERVITSGTVAGRDCEFYKPTETQIILMGRFVVRAQAAVKRDEGNVAVDEMTKVLDVVESLVVDAEDWDFFMALMTTGDLSIEDLISSLKLPAEDKAPTTGPKPRVTRGKDR